MSSFRKYAGKAKDATSVSLAKASSGNYKDLDVAVVKATNHIESPPKEKHVRTILAATSAARPRADIAYLINAIAKRLSKTHNWAVALKTLMVVHRCLREGDPTFREELINFSRNRNHLLNMAHFKDESSPPAWDYSAWVRVYALFLEERLECFRVLKYEVEAERSSGHSKTRELDTPDLLEQLPALQQTLYRLLNCQPEGAATSNFVIEAALGLVLKESFKLYRAINDGIINLVDKFFDMQRHDAIKALEIYKLAGKQAERLAEFYESCKSLSLGRSFQFPTLEQPPTSFLSTMEEYVRDAPRAEQVPREVSDGYEEGPRSYGGMSRGAAGKQEQEAFREPVPKPGQRGGPPAPPPVEEQPDFLGITATASPEHGNALDESNALALAIVPSGPTSNGGAAPASNGFDSASGSGWELAIVPSQDSNPQKVGNFDKLTLDSLYEDALTRRSPYTTPPGSYNSAGSYNGPVSSNPFAPVAAPSDPFAASSKFAPPPSVQMAQMRQQQAVLYQQQQVSQQGYGYGAQQQAGYAQPQIAANPFGTPYQAQPPAQAYNTNPFGNPAF
eukprot:TRINITY_DN192_c0_g1_i1.p1 TRINITY_DN192_c0_g1~~TRINITY_DN192_c0_g1_i1.p1  ORF type:complete len:562 (-),score=94.55 TRINITY_DN192_c0_g1_i1:55-1740(-)